ncbi:MAG: PVC-type heme-binding CxxCH protein, partial [Planctomycetota bacterium]
MAADAGQAKAVSFNDVVRKSEPLSAEDELKGFHLPPGFEIQLVASEPEINKPINIAFDAAGRLWVTSTLEYPFPAKETEKARDSIKILSEFDANGKAKKVVTFADGLNIPIGVLPYGKGAIGHSIPFIHYFEDTTGAGISDKRSVLLDRIGFQKDTHGMSGNFARGFDGWVYATHGFNNDSTIKALDGSEIKINSGNTYRFRPDGSHIEQYTWGQVNPFGLTFDALGNLYSCDCHTKPIYQLLRGGYYPSFGKKDDGLGFAPDMMKHIHGSTANCGIVVYSDDRFPAAYQDTVFTGNVMTCKINFDKLVTTGTTRIAQEQPDFLSADDPWFRPSCIQLGPDGALYVADFYNRIIGHYEVSLTHPGRDRERGRIWRIVYKGTPEKPVADTLPPNLTTKSADDLIALTGAPNLTLRMLAIWQIVDRMGAPSVEPLKAICKTGSPNQKICAIWALFNLKAQSDVELSGAVVDADFSVRTHAMRILSEMTTWNDTQRGWALNGLKDANAWVQRAAVDALGRHSHVDNVKPLIAIKAGADAADTHLVYTIRMAIRNQLMLTGIYDKIVALKLDANEMKALADSAVAAPSEDAAAVLVRHLAGANEAPAVAAHYFEHAMKYLPFNELDALVASARARFGSDAVQQLALLKAIQDGASQRKIELSSTVRAWAVETVEKILGSKSAPEESAWTALALDGVTPNPANPWVPQNRVSTDRSSDAFLCSLPRGESLTGIYRSKVFDLPEKLSFYVAGHNGQPGKKAESKNVVRLRDAGTKEL